jgi:hypothetical protein
MSSDGEAQPKPKKRVRLSKKAIADHEATQALEAHGADGPLTPVEFVKLKTGLKKVYVNILGVPKDQTIKGKLEAAVRKVGDANIDQVLLTEMAQSKTKMDSVVAKMTTLLNELDDLQMDRESVDEAQASCKDVVKLHSDAVAKIQEQIDAVAYVQGGVAQQLTTQRNSSCYQKQKVYVSHS